MLIKSMDKLKLKLLEMSETQRLDRHAELEVAYAESKDKIKMLENALKQSHVSEAALRSQLKKIMDAHMPLEKRG